MKRIKIFLLTCIFSLGITQPVFAMNFKNNDAEATESTYTISSAMLEYAEWYN